jgi:hypothetical protein
MTAKQYGDRQRRYCVPLSSISDQQAGVYSDLSFDEPSTPSDGFKSTFIVSSFSPVSIDMLAIGREAELFCMRTRAVS